ncbi:MAG: DNA polymerase III, subunit gamma and tau [Candidatus Pacebacteria bacterium CG_4_10_14_0_8_um_filter_43_12]|nr:MAG: DNA polymerase III, subunit gamma and tau [Candidatus Pacebacteria bacterium CG10_big_fil_rev_8_21_14_0_10_44_11]PIY79866.1 MAG: DNA polymerase III, subunit gamma and tau [Candidatus Pacebacteria bacterium CG_4_10_14_0_8_um_filter_43_12]
MSWNRIYRPKTFSQLQLTSVRNYFLSLLKSKTFPQVFLFTGPKGTGKTSTARIIGATLNDPANSQSVETLFLTRSAPSAALLEPNAQTKQLQSIYAGQSYLVQEMDAASNRGIDDIRALKEKVHLPPVGGIISVYILDEVHMLTTEAFNALLKLLEEPPTHVVFILATTEPQKVPETVVSRCQVVQFSQASEPELLLALQHVAQAEKLKLTAPILEFIAQQANGSFRDAIKLLEQADLLKLNDLESLREHLGQNYRQLIPPLVQAVVDKNSAQVISFFKALRQAGVNETAFHKDVAAYLYHQLVLAYQIEDGNAVFSSEVARFLLTQLSTAELSQNSLVPLLKLELRLLEVIDRAQRQKKGGSKAGTALIKSSSKTSDPVVMPDTNVKKSTTADTQQTDYLTPVSETITPSPQVVTSSNLSGDGLLLYQQWSDFVAQISENNFSLATLLKSARPVSGAEGEITLSVFYKFHQEQLLQPRFTQILNALITEQYGGPVKINCILSDQPRDSELAQPKLSNQLEQLAADVLM